MGIIGLKQVRHITLNQVDLIKDEDWTDLIVLDACRFDYFKEVHKEENVSGHLKRAINNNAYHTHDFYKSVVSNFDTSDVYLLSSSPSPFHGKTNKIHREFKESFKVWDLDSPFPSGSFNPRLTLKNVFKRLSNLSEDDRALIHLIPPHIPFLGDDAKDNLNRRYGPGYITKYGRKNGWDIIQKYYRDNLKIAFSALKEFKEIFRDPVVITSDHGNLLGEDNLFGHQKFDHEKIYEVPWFRWAR